MSDIKYPSTKEEKAKIYIKVMMEVKQRLAIIHTIDAVDVDPIIPIEICYLQLRHICELIAIACLTAQGDFSTYKEFKDSYDVSRVFRSLEKINPTFFPEPFMLTRNESYVEIKRNSFPDFITRDELEKLWGVTGNYLHRLTMRSFMKKKLNVIKENSIILEYSKRIKLLLNRHKIFVIGTNYQFFVHLYPSNSNIELDIYNQDEGVEFVHVDKFIIR